MKRFFALGYDGNRYEFLPCVPEEGDVNDSPKLDFDKYPKEQLEQIEAALEDAVQQLANRIGGLAKWWIVSDLYEDDVRGSVEPEREEVG